MYWNIVDNLTENGIEARNGNGYQVTVKPAVDVFENETSIVVVAEMPGINREDLSVQVKDHQLHIRGKKTAPKKGADYLIREIRDVVYERIFELEDDIDTGKINASYERGTLQVVLDKKPEPKPVEIVIN